MSTDKRASASDPRTRASVQPTARRDTGAGHRARPLFPRRRLFGARGIRRRGHLLRALGVLDHEHLGPRARHHWSHRAQIFLGTARPAASPRTRRHDRCRPVVGPLFCPRRLSGPRRRRTQCAVLLCQLALLDRGELRKPRQLALSVPPRVVPGDRGAVLLGVAPPRTRSIQTRSLEGEAVRAHTPRRGRISDADGLSLQPESGSDCAVLQHRDEGPSPAHRRRPGDRSFALGSCRPPASSELVERSRRGRVRGRGGALGHHDHQRGIHLPGRSDACRPLCGGAHRRSDPGRFLAPRSVPLARADSLRRPYFLWALSVALADLRRPRRVTHRSRRARAVHVPPGRYLRRGRRLVPSDRDAHQARCSAALAGDADRGWFHHRCCVAGRPLATVGRSRRAAHRPDGRLTVLSGPGPAAGRWDHPVHRFRRYLWAIRSRTC